jgi:hypothetical protein
VLEISDGPRKTLALTARPVADFYRDFMRLLQSAGIDVRIRKMPAEVPDPVPFDQNWALATYDRDSARTFWHMLLAIQQVAIHRQVQPCPFLLGQL